MEKEKKETKRKIFLGVLVVLSVLLCLFLGVLGYQVIQVNKYREVVLPNVYLEEHKLGHYPYDQIRSRLEFLSDHILETKIAFRCQGKDYFYSMREVGLSLDYEKIENSIKSEQDRLGYHKKYLALSSKKKKVYSYSFQYDKTELQQFLQQLKIEVDTPLVNGYFEASNGQVRYVPGIDSFSLDIDASLKQVEENIQKGITKDTIIELMGVSEKALSNEKYATIDTKVSSFSTEFDASLYARVTNLQTALNYINGAIVETGDVFSFYKYAGPYNKKGYVFYYEFVGNGVCQIATTTYNAVLLGGLEVVKRYPHAAKSPYVAGGLDATVASYSSGWNVDFQFKNTYQYPIYISAYMVGNKAYVEFWSNQKAMDGKTYATESVLIGKRGYTTYLYTLKDGIQLDKRKIATTWYTKD